MLKKFRKTLDKGRAHAALLKNLSKAFDCLRHDLIIAMVHAYCFDTPSLKLVNS